MRVLSGIQPSGVAHIGNYFGYIKPNVDLLDDGEIFLMIADLHALTTVHDPKQLSEFRTNVALDLLAAGFDANKGTLFFQSAIPEHTELMWILSCLTPMGLLERAVAYKEKVQKGIDASVGLFTYPVLQAADILLYQASHVPVGKDQKQHIEIARDLSIKFNNAFGDTFAVPEPVIREYVAVVPGTDGQKMSKSYGNTIPLFGAESAIKKAIMGITTDSRDATDPKDPDTCTIYQLHRLFLSVDEASALADDYRNGLSYGDAKKRLLAAYMDYFSPMRAKRAELEANTALLEEVMQQGADKASAIANRTLDDVYKVVGLRG